MGFGLLARALETKTLPMRYEEYIETKILQELGMVDSGFDSGYLRPYTKRFASRLARGKYSSEQMPESHMGWGTGDGGMYTTAADMTKFLKFLCSDTSTLLKTKTKRTWYQPHKLLPDGVSGFGMPWEILRPSSRWILTKSGNVDQFGAFVALDPDGQYAMWMNVNEPGEMATQVGSQIMGLLSDAFTATLGTQAAYLTQSAPSQPEKFVGVHQSWVQSVFSNMTVTITYTNSQLSAIFSWKNGQTAIPANLFGDSANANHAVIHLPVDLPFPCIVAAELAWEGHHMVFDFTQNSFRMPGLLPPSTFVKVSG